MLVTRRSRDRLVLVTHPDHGVLVGDLADRWGDGRFAAPARPRSFVDAAIHHDDGWLELDGEPMYDAEAQRPAHFLEVDLPRTLGAYGRGVDEVHARDPYAGALVSMHWSGLYSTRWGIQPGPPVGHPAVAAVVAEQEARWIAALRAAWDGDGLRSVLEAGAWHGYELLQALDFVSLHLCLVDGEQPTDQRAEPLPMPGVLRTVEQPPGARTIPNVPTDVGGEHVELTMVVVEPFVLEVHPWPFATDELTVSVPARTIEDRAYTQDEAAAAYAAAPAEPIDWTLVGR